MTLRLPSLVLLLSTAAALFVSAGCANSPAAGPATVTLPSTPTPVATAPGVVTRHGRLQVAGTKIVGADGQPVSLAGVSYGWSQWQAARFYNAGVVNWVKQDWKADIVRLPLGIHEEDGYFQHPKENLARVIAGIDAALAADLYVLVDWHDHNAHLHAAQSIAFFQAIARRYGDRPNIIYEIYNEPKGGHQWARDVKPYTEQVVAAIRAIDPDNLIVAGTPTWSQDVDIAAADPVKDANLAYSIHFYAGTHKEGLRAKALKAFDLGAALFVTEWGTCDASGEGAIDDASVRTWLAFMREHQLSHCNWGIYDKLETASIVLPSAASTGGWKDADLTPSGRYVRDIVRAWSAP
jgi:endoglucanase